MAWRSPQHMLLHATRVLCTGLLLALTASVGQAAAGGPSFPSGGYGTLLRDAEDPAVPDNVDIVEVGYQQDGTYAFFRVSVAGTASLASDRHLLYFDVDGDGLPDRRLLNTSGTKARMESWSGTQYQSYSSGWCLDPNDTPDDHVYFACLLSDVNGGDFSVTAVAADTPSGDDPAIRDPLNNPNFSEVTGGSVNPTAVEAAGFSAARDGVSVRLTWRATAPALVIGFNVYLAPADGGPARRLNDALVVGDAETSFGFVDPAPAPGVYRLEAVAPDGRQEIVAAAVAEDVEP